MKKTFVVTTILICVCSIFLPLQAQNPTYEAYLKNGVFTGPNQLEFDIYVKRTGAIPFEVYGLQHGLIYDNSFLNGGTPTLTYISGTSQMNASQIPTYASSHLLVSGKRVIRIQANISPNPGGGTIISNIGQGTRFGRFRLTTSASSFALSHHNLDWNFNQSYRYVTKHFAYVGGVSMDITVQSSHVSLLSPCYSVTPNYEARLINDTQTSSNTYEFDIYLKSTYSTLRLFKMDVCLIFDDTISGGGKLSSNYIAGTSEMSIWQIPEDPNISTLVAGKRVWKLMIPGVEYEASTIISSTGNGTRLGRFRISTSASSFSNSRPNLIWNFNSIYGLETKVYHNNYIPPFYYCMWEVTTPSTHFNNLSNPILPVELVSFRANVINDKKVLLEWSTATETNNYGFEVQRKILSRQSAVSDNEFEKIGFVEGSRNSSSTKHYSFVDNQLNGGNKFAYRLKQIDHDGTFSYSSIQEVELTLSKYELTQNYPNPFNPATTIEYSLPQASDVSLTLYNLLGEKVKDIVDEYKESGIYKVDFDASNIASGSYIYILRANGNTISKKMIILR